MLPEVLPLRRASRELVRELGFLQDKDAATSLSHSHCHAMIEIEARKKVAQSELPALLRLDKSTTSRIVADLVGRGWLRARPSRDDARARDLMLTASGRAQVKVVHREANARVEQALGALGEDDRRVVLRGMELYARALERSRRASSYAIRPIRAGDRAAVARLIRTVMPEFGAKGPGFAINDPEVDDMFGAYQSPRSAYFVVTRAGARPEDEDVVVGGCGYAPLSGGDGQTCELRKMYFLPEVRGLGLGQKLLAQCLARSRRAGFTRMYLETLGAMSQARALYERSGFYRLEKPMGDTGHFGCNSFYLRELTT
ncbi:MAG TPA: helix-turn-helix domain-containing GNAT family N-acetyltransferase [Labilithrix sp.]|nr:helix-turn-helix domain-containing GNAT family N-acetyltransferase [Labilithrix sp.]